LQQVYFLSLGQYVWLYADVPELGMKRIVLELTEVMQVSSLCYMFDCLTLFMMFVIVGE
jgi:hypothetical protein